MTLPARGRRKPYTTRGIRRVPCARCGLPSRYQWQICATGNLWQGVCAGCDIGMNRAVLKFMRVPKVELAAIMAEYVQRVGRDG